MSISLRKTVPLFLLLLVVMGLWLLPKAYADDYSGLAAAVNGGAASYSIKSDTTIPANTTLDAGNTKIIVPVGFHLIVDGKLTLRDWDLNAATGSLVVRDGGELHIAASHNLAGNIWKRWHEDGSIDRVSFADGVVLTVGCRVDSEEDLFNTISHLSRDLGDHVNCEIGVLCDASVPESMTIPLGFTLHVENTFTIPEGVVLNSDAWLTVESAGCIIVNGTLINHNFVDINYRETPITPALSVSGSGIYTGGGTLAMKDFGNNLAAYVSGIDLNKFDSAVDQGLGTRFIPKETLKTFANLKAACARGDAYFDLTDAEDVTITEDLTIPAGMTVVASGTQFIVPVGKHVTVEGTLVLTQWTLNRQTEAIVVPQGGELIITGWCGLPGEIWTAWHDNGSINGIRFADGAGVELRYGVPHEEAFTNTLSLALSEVGEHVRASIDVNYNAALPESMELPSQIQLNLNYGLTIPADAVLTLNGQLYVAPAATLTVNGTLVNNNFVDIDDRASGTAFAVNGAYAGRGGLGIQDHGDLQRYVSGLNLSALDSEEDNNGTRFYLPQGGKTFADLKAACASGATSFDLTNAGDFEITEDLTIPAGMTVVASGTRIIVPVGKQIIVNGTLILTGWNFNGQTHAVVIPQGGELIIAAWTGLAGNIWDGWVDNGSVNRVYFADNAGLYLDYPARDNDELRSRLDTAANNTNEHLYYNIRTEYAPTISGNVTVPGNATLIIVRQDLTVPANAVLTVYGTVTAASDVAMNIDGALLNFGFVEMEARSSTSGPLLRINGKYRGAGGIGIRDASHQNPEGYIGMSLENYRREDDDIGTRFFFHGEPDFFLPADLTEIGEEAFAGGAFHFVWPRDSLEKIGSRAFADCPNLAFIRIPPSTTEIAADAFEGTIGVTIYCDAGSEAQAFADRFDFAYILVS